MNRSLSTKSQNYIAVIFNQPAAFIAVIQYPHPIIKHLKKIHRLVVLPDFQGIGLGKILLDNIAALYAEKNNVMITTSHPAMRKMLNRSANWKMNRCGRTRPQRGSTKKSLNRSVSSKRITASYEFLRAENNKKRLDIIANV